MHRKLWIRAYIIGLTAFTIYISLDTFVIPSTYKKNATEMNTSMFAKSVSDEVEKDSDAEDTSNEAREEVSTDVDTEIDSSESEITKEQDANTETAKQNHSQKGVKKRGSTTKKRIREEDSTTEEESTKNSTTEENSTKDSTTEENSTKSSATAESAAAESVTTNSANREYHDDNIDITLKEYEYEGSAVYVADIQLSSAEYLKTAFAQDTYGKNVTDTTSQIAEDNDAILAINGDYYGVQESGYVIRNGVVYRDVEGDEDVLCIYADGGMKVVDPSTVTAEELVEQGVWQAFSFGPSLIENGSIAVSENDEVGKAKTSNPRTAIGLIDENHYVFVVSDGRTEESEGLSLYELAQFMETLGVKTAYNLDGGGSSTMVFKGTVINNPTTSGNSIKERGVSDIVYIG